MTLMFGISLGLSSNIIISTCYFSAVSISRLDLGTVTIDTNSVFPILYYISEFSKLKNGGYSFGQSPRVILNSLK